MDTAEGLRALLELQAHDTAIDQIRHRRQHHPLRDELASVESETASLTARRQDAGGRLGEVARRQSELEAEVDATARRLAEVDRRMYSGEISASRDLEAMSEQAASLKRRQSNLEDQVLEQMEAREPLDAEVGELDSELARLEARRAEVTGALAEADAELASAERAELGTREEVAARVPAELMERYERLRSRLGGVAVARLDGARCGGCHLTLPATELDRIRHAAPDAVATCEQCGRILVRDAA